MFMVIDTSQPGVVVGVPYVMLWEAYGVVARQVEKTLVEERNTTFAIVDEDNRVYRSVSVSCFPAGIGVGSHDPKM